MGLDKEVVRLAMASMGGILLLAASACGEQPELNTEDLFREMSGIVDTMEYWPTVLPIYVTDEIGPTCESVRGINDDLKHLASDEAQQRSRLLKKSGGSI